MNDSLFAKTSTNSLLGMPDGGELGSMALDVSINGSRFTLIYRAREDSFDGSSQQIARGLVSFAKQCDCNYALLLGNNCWMAEVKGLSIVAQFEDSPQLKDYQLVVVPLDEAIYMAEIEDGLVSQEKVYPIAKGLEFLIAQKDNQDDKLQVAVISGGMAAKALHQEGFEVNYPYEIVTRGKAAQTYTYQSINLLLLKHRLYHPRLLILGAAIVAVVLSLSLFFYYYSREDTRIIVEQTVEEKVEQIQQIAVVKKPDFLNNHAAQILRQIRPWILSPQLDFLTTCRLTAIVIGSSDLSYQGQWMDNLVPGKEGCGNKRLKQVIKDNQLQLLRPQAGWEIRGIELVAEVDSVPRVPTQQTLYQLDLLADHIGWQINIQSTDRDGDNRDIKLTLAGDQLDGYILDHLIAKLLTLPARMQRGRLQFNPDSLSLTEAKFYITLFAVGENAP